MASSLHLNGGGVNMSTRTAAPGHYLIASDFDQTLSFNDSGLVLSELIGVSNFREKVAGLSEITSCSRGRSSHTSFAAIPSSGASAASIWSRRGSRCD